MYRPYFNSFSLESMSCTIGTGYSILVFMSVGLVVLRDDSIPDGTGTEASFLPLDLNGDLRLVILLFRFPMMIFLLNEKNTAIPLLNCTELMHQ